MKVNINILSDLGEIKKADLKRKVFIIISKWREQIHFKEKEFTKEFLSDDNDKSFKKLKDLIGEFEELKRTDVLTFLFNVIVVGSEEKLLKEMHEEYLKLAEYQSKTKDYIYTEKRR